MFGKCVLALVSRETKIRASISNTSSGQNGYYQKKKDKVLVRQWRLQHLYVVHGTKNVSKAEKTEQRFHAEL